MASKKYALILSGGAARGAYEVGVLQYIFQNLGSRYRLPQFDVICGTSVGAIHGCFLTAHLSDPVGGLNRLSNIWTNLSPGQVVRLDAGQLFSIKDLIWGGQRGKGLLDISPLKILLGNEGNWGHIHNSIRSGLLETLCVSTTSARSGRTIVFTDTNQPLPQTLFRTEFRSARIGLDHALASASIPLLFPPVKIGNEWFTDGGVRQNTPIAPALALGATHVLSVGLWHERKASTTLGDDTSPSVGCLLGKIFNSFFLDHAHVDLQTLEHINNILVEGGEELQARMANLPRPYKYITSCNVSPSDDIGRFASEYLETSEVRGNRFYRALLKAVDVGTFEADLASYLLFDGGFSRLLIELGYRDAQAREHELAKFFDLDEEQSL